MTTQIEAADIADWDSLTDIADSLEKRGLKLHPYLGPESRTRIIGALTASPDTTFTRRELALSVL